MLVAVTGGTGFIGSHTTAALVRAGHDVRLLVRDPRKLERVFGDGGLRVEIEHWIEGDAANAGAVERLVRGCDAVFHAAAVVAFEAGRADEVRATNRRTTEAVLAAAMRASVERIVYVSSAGALFTPGGPPITADSPIGKARSAYGESKADAERYVRQLQRDGAPILTVYPTGAIGPDDPGLTEPNHALKIMIDLVAPETSTGYQPVDVRDLADVHVALVESKQPSGRFVAAGRYHPWSDLFDRIEALTGRPLRRVRAPAPLLRALGVAADVVKRVVPFALPLTRETMEFATRWQPADASPTESELGIRFRDLDETLVDTLRWLVRAGHLRPEQIGLLAG